MDGEQVAHAGTVEPRRRARDELQVHDDGVGDDETLVLHATAAPHGHGVGHRGVHADDAGCQQQRQPTPPSQELGHVHGHPATDTDDALDPRQAGGSGLQGGLVERLCQQGDRRPRPDRRLEQLQWLRLADQRPAARQPLEFRAQEAASHAQVGMAGARHECRVHVS